MLDDSGNPLIDEPETPTEKLRRLRYEAQELEEQLEADAAESTKAKEARRSLEDEEHDEESEYEAVDDLPRRDDADKTKPPPNRRRRKKPQVDENGELSPAVLLKQLKRLRNGLNGISLSENSVTGEYSSSEASSEARNKDLLKKLSMMKSHAISSDEKLDAPLSHASMSTSKSSLSQFDTRIDLLEKYVGTNEADIDEVCSFTLIKSCLSALLSNEADHALSIVATVSAITAALAYESDSPRASAAPPHPTASSGYCCTASQDSCH